MSESTPGLQKNSTTSGNADAEYNSEFRNTSTREPFSSAEEPFENGNYHQHLGKIGNSESENENTNNSGSFNDSTGIHRQLDISYGQADHINAENSENSGRRPQGASSSQSEPGPIFSNESTQNSVNFTSKPKLPQHFRRNSKDTAGQLPNPAWGDSDWPGLHSPTPNPFFNSSQDENERNLNIGFNSILSASNIPSLNSPPNQNIQNRPPRPSLHLFHSAGPSKREEQDSLGASNTLKSLSSSSSTNQSILLSSQSNSGISSFQHSIRPHSRPFPKLPLPIIRPISKGNHYDSRPNSNYDTSDSESSSSIFPSDPEDPPVRRHRHSSSIGVQSLGSSHSIASLHDPSVLRQFPSICSVMTSEKSQPGQQRPKQYEDAAGRMATDMWKEEGTVCLVVKLRGIAVTRRCDNNMINGTKLLNSARISRGRRDGMLKAERIRHVVRVGGMDYKGVWVPFERAMEMAKQENVLDMLYPLFLADLREIFRIPENYSRLMQILRGATINDQFSMWLSSINSSETYSPGYHFYPRRPDPDGQKQVIRTKAFDEELAHMMEESSARMVLPEDVYSHEQHDIQEEHGNDTTGRHQQRSNENENQLVLSSSMVKLEPDQFYEMSLVFPRTGNSATATRPSGLTNYGLRQFNPEEFMQPPMELYTAYLKLAYQSYDPRHREHWYYDSEEDEMEMDTDIE